ncbi:MAG: hypothetical protein MK171_06675 [Pirellulales bacterium]|nr:hypothetical protein [Pirellulales bacterium]
MNATVWTELIAAVHASGHPLVVAVTGGGSKAISQLLEVPGASQSVLEAVVPYSGVALANWLGGAPDQSASGATARAMAMASWMRARCLSGDADVQALIGLAATASLAGNRAKRGQHRIHVAAQTATSTSSASLVLNKGQRLRKKEEWIAAGLLLVTLGQIADIATDGAEQALMSQLTDGETIEWCERQADSAWTELLLGQRNWSALPSPDVSIPQVIFPGSFNPPHLGHRRMALVAAQRTGRAVAYELSITNVDKPPLDFIEMGHRFELLQALDGEAVLALTDAHTFRAKSELFPGCTFVVGVDTMQRIANADYYTGNCANFADAVREIGDRGCRFLVFGRRIGERFEVLSDLSIPAPLGELCDEVTEMEFREDISSTRIRQER